METHDLRKAGLKVTHPRMRILEILEASDGKHMTAEDIYRDLLDHHDDIGLATVYRVLTQFESAGLVLKHNFEGGQAVYEVDRGKHHDHMVDIESGKVIEFTSDEIEKLQRDVADKYGYQIEDHSLVLYVRPKKKHQALTRCAFQHLLRMRERFACDVDAAEHARDFVATPIFRSTFRCRSRCFCRRLISSRANAHDQALRPAADASRITPVGSRRDAAVFVRPLQPLRRRCRNRLRRTPCIRSDRARALPLRWRD